MSKLFKHCPNCTSEHTIFTHHHKFECEDCGYVYYHNVASAVTLIVKRGEEILFTRRNMEPMKGMLDLPGGFVDPNESIEFAAKRELKEELGIEERAVHLKYYTSEPNVYWYKEVEYRTCDIAFIADLKQNEFLVDADEIAEICWINIKDVDIDAIGFASIKKIVSKYLNESLD